MAQSSSQSTQALVPASGSSQIALANTNPNKEPQQTFEEFRKIQQQTEPVPQTTQALVPASSSSQIALANANPNRGNGKPQQAFEEFRKTEQQQTEPVPQTTQALVPASGSSQIAPFSSDPSNRNEKAYTEQQKSQMIQAEKTPINEEQQSTTNVQSREPSESALGHEMDCDNEQPKSSTLDQQQNHFIDQEKSRRNVEESRNSDMPMNDEPASPIVVSDENDNHNTEYHNVNQSQPKNAKYYNEALKKTFGTPQGPLSPSSVKVKKEPVSCNNNNDINSNDWLPLSQKGQDRQIDNDDAKVIGWLAGYGKSYLVQYGPRNSATYKIVPARFFPSDYEPVDGEEITNSDNRLGEQKIHKKYVFGTEHVVDIYGVAWRPGKHTKQSVEILNPDNEDRPAQYPHTYLLILWEKDNQRFKTWETRTTLRQRWGHAEADYEIYSAACEAQKRYEAFRSNRRTPLDRSPTPGVIAAKAKDMRNRALAQKSTVYNGPDHPPAPATTAKGHVQFETPRKQTDRSQYEVQDFIKDHCIIYGKDQHELNLSDRQQILRTWLHYKETGELQYE